MNKLKIMLDIAEERDRQDNKWGGDRNQPPGMWLAILTEEVGELAREVLNFYAADARTEDAGASEARRMRAEAVQVAAVAVALIEYIDRTRLTHPPADVKRVDVDPYGVPTFDPAGTTP